MFAAMAKKTGKKPILPLCVWKTKDFNTFLLLLLLNARAYTLPYSSNTEYPFFHHHSLRLRADDDDDMRTQRSMIPAPFAIFLNWKCSFFKHSVCVRIQFALYSRKSLSLTAEISRTQNKNGRKRKRMSVSRRFAHGRHVQIHNIKGLSLQSV